eukprot:jgi/Mesvir1/22639/Mv14074-RA.1
MQIIARFSVCSSTAASPFPASRALSPVSTRLGLRSKKLAAYLTPAKDRRSYGSSTNPKFPKYYATTADASSDAPGEGNISAEEVARRYNEVAEAVGNAAVSAGRKASDVKLVAVTKTFVLSHVLPAHQRCGCVDFGENRLEEALQKAAEASAGGFGDIRWHFIGTVQSRKVKPIVESQRFSLVHSVDAAKLAQKFSKTVTDMRAKAPGTPDCPILLQVNTSGEETKSGMAVEDWRRAADEGLFQLPGLSFQGLMTMAPFTDDEAILHKTFERLRLFRDELQPHVPTLKELSMGMTNDFAIAIQEGATIVRVGRQIFGER